MDEAQFSWISVNTLLSNVGPDENPIPSKNGSQGLCISAFWLQPTNSNVMETYLAETAGALDLGGASTQLAMEMRNGQGNVSGLLSQSNNLWREYNVRDLQLYGRNYSVYSHSSLCYGVFEVIKRYESMLIVDSETNGTNVLDSPCQPLGYSTVVKADRVFNTPCSQNRSTNVQQWTLNGTSNYAQCSTLIQRLFNLTYCQSHFLPQTCFSAEGQPSLESQDFMVELILSFLPTELDSHDTIPRSRLSPVLKS